MILNLETNFLLKRLLDWIQIRWLYCTSMWILYVIANVIKEIYVQNKIWNASCIVFCGRKINKKSHTDLSKCNGGGRKYFSVVKYDYTSYEIRVNNIISQFICNCEIKITFLSSLILNQRKKIGYLYLPSKLIIWNYDQISDFCLFCV